MMRLLSALAPLLAAYVPSYLASLGAEPTRCSACDMVATKFDEVLAKPNLIRGWREWTTEQRVSKLKAALGKVCPKFDAVQVCKHGWPPKYADFQDLMSKGGSMSGLSMGPEQKREVQALCEQLSTKDEVARIVGRIEVALEPPSKGSRKAHKARRRLIDLSMRVEMCQGLHGTCVEQDHEDDEADEDDDDRDL